MYALYLYFQYTVSKSIIIYKTLLVSIYYIAALPKLTKVLKLTFKILKSYLPRMIFISDC